MIIKPMIPIWLMVIICIGLLVMKRKGTFSFIRQILIVVLLFVVNLRPSEPLDYDIADGTTGIDILFVVDNTISMLAEDYRGNGRRIDAVKDDCLAIMEAFPGASFSVVTFDNSVQLVTPYTTDVTMTTQVINLLKGQTKMNAVGTSLNDVMEMMEGFLDKDRNTHQIVFFISDGEETMEERLRSYSDLEEYVETGAVLGYGTEEGGRMMVEDYRGDYSGAEYLTYYDDDYREVEAVSCIDEDNLESIADDFGVEYIHMTKPSKVDEVIELVENELELTDEEEAMATKETSREYYYILLIPLAVLLVYDFIHYRRSIFRKGQ